MISSVHFRTLLGTIKTCGNTWRERATHEITIPAGGEEIHCFVIIFDATYAECFSGLILHRMEHSGHLTSNMLCRCVCVLMVSIGDRGMRLKKHAAHDRELVPYDSKLDGQHCIYFPGTSVCTA